MITVIKHLLRGAGWMAFFVVLSLLTPIAFKYTPGISLALLGGLVIGLLWNQTRATAVT